MAIYQRDNINYGGMLGNAMANRANYLQHKYDAVRQMGQNWGNAIQQSGQTIQNAFNQAAQYQYNKDQLANQQQFQAEQAALNRAQQLNMAREQQKFQEQENALNRENTYNIAALNRQNSLDERNAEKQAQAIMHYDVQKGILNSIADEIMRTDDPAKLAQLYRQRDEAAAKLNYYAPMVPDAYKGQRYGDSFQGFQMGMGKDRIPQAPQVQAEQPQPATGVETVANRMAGLIAAGKAATKPEDIQSSINELSALDTSKLNDTQRSDLKAQIATLNANLSKAKKAAALKVEAQASYDKLPKGINGNVKPGSLARWKAEHPDYAKVLNQ